MSSCRRYRDTPGPSKQEKSRIRKYTESRRAIRVWPIKGKNPSEISAALRRFLQEALTLSTADIGCLGIKFVERTRTPSNSMHQDEVRVTFSDPFLRDEFAAKGNLLANYIKDGRPTAGFRLDVPDYLGGDFKVLMEYGFMMRRIHGKDTRRYIKYDDDNYGLIMELRVPQSNVYLRISPDLARSMNEENARDELQWIRSGSVGHQTNAAPPPSANFSPLGNPTPSSSRGTRTDVTASLQRLASCPMEEIEPASEDETERNEERSPEATWMPPPRN